MNYFENSLANKDLTSASCWIFLYNLIVFVFASVALGMIRSLQLAAFYVPLSFLLAWHLPIFIKKILLFTNLVFCLLIISFSGIQGFLYKNYDATIDSSFVIEALANTNLDESVSYVQAGLEQLLLWGLFSLLVFIFCCICLTTITRASLPRSKRILAFVSVLVLLFIFSFYQDAWRKRFPLFIYANLFNAIEAQQDYWEEIENENKGYLSAAKKLISSVEEGPKTIVLIIGESTSREDMSLYGYPRNTTPRLKEIETKDPLFII